MSRYLLNCALRATLRDFDILQQIFKLACAKPMHTILSLYACRSTFPWPSSYSSVSLFSAHPCSSPPRPPRGTEWYDDASDALDTQAA